jgi:large subunit ribosomal protein L24
MPLHLSEELSPRFSRAKRTAGFNMRRTERAAAVGAHARASVAAWEAGGRDAGLLTDPSVQSALGAAGMGEELAGMARNRTRAEVRDAARQEALEMDKRVAAGVRDAVKRGLKYDADKQVWSMADKAARTERKQRRRVLKEDKVVRRMEGLRLGQGRNAVVPDAVRL